jgi:hypothetical protein
LALSADYRDRSFAAKLSHTRDGLPNCFVPTIFAHEDCAIP